jgi:hypothetical protein
MQAVMQEFLNYIGNLSNVPAEATAVVLETIRKYYQELTEPQMLGFAFFKITELIVRSKPVPEHTQQLYEQCAFDLIDRSIDS